MKKRLAQKQTKLSVVGLGYVGLPLALEFGKHFSVIGFDINSARIDDMKNNIDPSHELDSSDFDHSDVVFTDNINDLVVASFHVIAVPTPVDEDKLPDLQQLILASKMLGKILKKGDYVVFESTVYPGCTEEVCLPILEKESGFTYGKDFKLGYSPERINPGDKVRTLTKILKIVSACDQESLDTISDVYETIIEAGIYKAESIRVAEAAKIVENIQRDLNISLMNELSMIFDMMDIDTKQVLEAAGTKWNFLQFYPGLVGGHCIDVDPYYLLYKSRELGYNPQVILSGRKINDSMPSFVAKKLVSLFKNNEKKIKGAKVLVMGVTFKENVSDIRNSKIFDLISELKAYSINCIVYDPYASKSEVEDQHQIELIESVKEVECDAIVLAVNHDEYKQYTIEDLAKKILNKPILLDLKGTYSLPIDESIIYWRL
jgi:UDP-N-acetyl-D-galactosamine dehydrogenase